MTGPNRTGADSAGVPWANRQVHGSGFAADSGVTDPVLEQALQNISDEPSLVNALAAARVLVPIVATLGEADQNTGGDKSAEMAVVTLQLPDGRRALPVFSGMEALAAWDPAARPQPVSAAKAAQAAISEQCDTLLLDLARPDGPVVIRPSMVWALAQEQQWLPAHEDPQVDRAVRRAVQDEDPVAGVLLEPGSTPGELRIVLLLRPGLDQAQLQAVAQRIGERIATDGEVRARIDALSFAVRMTG